MSRVQYVTQKSSKALWRHISKAQVEKKFGGSLPDFEGEYWPPKMPEISKTQAKKNCFLEEKEYFYHFAIGDVDSLNQNFEIIDKFQNSMPRMASAFEDLDNEF